MDADGSDQHPTLLLLTHLQGADWTSNWLMVVVCVVMVLLACKWCRKGGRRRTTKPKKTLVLKYPVV